MGDTDLMTRRSATEVVRAVVFLIISVCGLIALDQITKVLAVCWLKTSEPVCVVRHFFNLVYVENRGAAWGVFQGNVIPLAIFSIGALALVAWKRRAIFAVGFFGRLAEAFFYAGVSGNLADRLFRGHVIDFFDFHWFSHHFPVFNFADVFITFAAVILIFESVFPKSRHQSDF